MQIVAGKGVSYSGCGLYQPRFHVYLARRLESDGVQAHRDIVQFVSYAAFGKVR